MVRCAWVKSDIVRIILKSGIIDPLENHINVVRWERNVSCNRVDYNFHPRSIRKPMNILTQLLTYPFNKHVRDILTPLNINDSFHNPNRFNVNIELVQRALKRPECGLWENAEHLWPLQDHTLRPTMQKHRMAFSCCTADRT